MKELEKTARELIWAITEKTLKTLYDKGLLKEPSKLQMLCSSPEMTSLIKKISDQKYDPCRLLRKGDKVQVKKRDGRCNGKDGEYLREAFCTVAADETQNELVRVLHNATEYRLDPAYLELVQPVEELEPYFVEQQGEKTGGFCFTVRKRTGYCEATFYFGAARSRDKQQAKAAAEAERDRLNAEYRKEQK